MNQSIPSLTISIVVYRNDGHELMKAVNSVMQSEGINLKLYIIDNSPTDDLRHLFHDNRIEYIFNNANLGFGRGHNIAIKRALEESKYHLCLNPDIYFSKDVLRKIIDYMDSNPNVGQLLPKILNNDGVLVCKQRHLLPTPFITFFRGIFGGFPFTRRLTDRYFTRFKSYEEEMSSPFLSGCFVFLRNSVIEEVGMFDERYFMYYEDVDLSRRIFSHIGNIYWPGVTITHIGHMDSHKSWKLARIHLQSAIRYYNKWGWFDKERRRINGTVVSKYNN